MTQTQMAALLKVSRMTVSDWIRGKKLPARENLESIYSVTGGEVTPNDFVDLTKPIKKPLTRPVSKRNTKITGVNAQEEGRV